MKYFRALTFILPLVLTAFLLTFVAAQHPVVRDWITTSDQLTIPNLVVSSIDSPFGLYGWQVPRSSFLFPDALIYAGYYLVTKIRYLSILLTASTILAAWMLTIYYTNCWLGRMSNSVAALWAAIAGGLVPYLLLSCFPHLGHLVIKYQFNIASHFTAFVLAIVIIIGSVKHLVSNVRGAGYLTYALTALTAASNRATWAYIVPSVLFVVILELVRNRNPVNWKALRFGFIILLSMFIGFLLESLLNRQEAQPYDLTSVGMLGKLRIFALSLSGEFASNPQTGILFTALLLFYLWQMYRISLAILSVHCREENPALREPLTFKASVTISALANIPAAAIAWQTIDSSRYLMPFIFGFFIMLPLVVPRLARSRNLLFFTTSIIVVAVAIFDSGYLSRFSVLDLPSKNLRSDISLLNDCVVKYNLHRGLANYWLARKITFLSNDRIRLDQLVPWDAPSLSRMIFYWGNNATAYLNGGSSNDPYDYIVANELNEVQLIAELGEPQRKLTCGSFKLLTYGDEHHIYREFLRGHGEIFDRELFGKGVVSIPGALFFSQNGRYINLSVVRPSDSRVGGFLAFGNSVQVFPGYYRFAVAYRTSGKNLDSIEKFFDIATDSGKVILGNISLTPQDNPRYISREYIDIYINHPMRVEPRIYVGSSSSNVKMEVESISISKMHYDVKLK